MYLTALITTLSSERWRTITPAYKIGGILMILLCLLSFSEGRQILYWILTTLLPTPSRPS